MKHKGRQTQPHDTAVVSSQLLTSNEIGRPLLVIVFLLIAIVVTSVSITYQSYQFRQLFNTQQQLVVHW